MNKQGWKGNPIEAVRMPDGKLTTIDNTRLAAARVTNTPVKVLVRDHTDELAGFLKPRFTTNKGIPETWGEAVNLRIKKQTQQFSKKFPNGSDQLPRMK